MFFGGGSDRRPGRGGSTRIIGYGPDERVAFERIVPEWLALFIIFAAAGIGMLVIHANREHDRRHAAFLAACARTGHDSGRCDFYWLIVAQRAPSNDTGLSLISTPTR